MKVRSCKSVQYTGRHFSGANVSHISKCAESTNAVSFKQQPIRSKVILGDTRTRVLV